MTGNRRTHKVALEEARARYAQLKSYLSERFQQNDVMYPFNNVEPVQVTLAQSVVKLENVMARFEANFSPDPEVHPRRDALNIAERANGEIASLLEFLMDRADHITDHNDEDPIMCGLLLLQGWQIVVELALWAEGKDSLIRALKANAGKSANGSDSQSQSCKGGEHEAQVDSVDGRRDQAPVR